MSFIKRFGGYLAAGVLLSTIIPAAAFAQQLTIESVPVAQPELISVNPTIDPLVNLTNLRVTQIDHLITIQDSDVQIFPPQNRPHTIITATSDLTLSCRAYESESSARALPCPLPPIQQYRISIDDNTRVLGKNRTFIESGDIEVGDRVNVFGFANGNGNVQAIILRDLDKPVSAQEVQLENLSVVDFIPEGDNVRLYATHSFNGCFAFASNKKLAYPCPLGYEPAPNVKERLASVVSSNLSIAAPVRLYEIIVPRTAKVMDKNRKAISIKEVETGDRINVYGLMRNPRTGTILAEVLRDLSKPSVQVEPMKIVQLNSTPLVVGEQGAITFGVKGGTTPYQWSVDPSTLPLGMFLAPQPVIACFTTPCPQPEQREQRIVGAPAKGGTYNFVMQATDSRGQSTRFTAFVSIKDREVPKAVEVSVATDKDHYMPYEEMQITVTARNTTNITQSLQFKNGCQANYAVEPGFDLRAVQLCTLAFTQLDIPAFGQKTWKFTHSLSRHPLPEMKAQFKVIGRVDGLGEASKAISVGEGGSAAPVISSLTAPQFAIPLEEVFLSVSAYSPSGNQLTYTIDWGDRQEFLYKGALLDSALAIAPEQNTRFSHRYQSSGTYHPRVTVSDGIQSASAEVSLFVR